jgi:hypothetical protein
MGIDTTERLVFFPQVFEDLDQRQVFQDIGEIAGME